MSKKLRIIIAIIVIIILGVAGFFIAKKIEQENRKYNIENISEYNYFVIKEDNKYGIMDKEGKTIIEPNYDNIKIPNPTKAVFNVDNYKTYLSIQCDTALRNVARLYPYDVNDASEEKTLRGSSQEVADKLKEELQTRVNVAGIEVCEVRITHLAYAPEIAAAMLQRQQAEAIIAARKKIVEGAVGMVEMALNSLNENDIVKLDDEKKAAMVSNLLVVLCGNKDAQPVVNSGNLN